MMITSLNNNYWSRKEICRDNEEDDSSYQRRMGPDINILTKAPKYGNFWIIKFPIILEYAWVLIKPCICIHIWVFNQLGDLSKFGHKPINPLMTDEGKQKQSCQTKSKQLQGLFWCMHFSSLSTDERNECFIHYLCCCPMGNWVWMVGSGSLCRCNNNKCKKRRQ